MIKLKNLDKNYSASIVSINNLVKLQGLDNLRGCLFMGMQALVPNDYEQGKLGVLFPTECQLSNDFVMHNCLYRKADLNIDTSKTGYLEENRRVRALKLRGHVSDALFLPISSLEYLGIDISQLKEGDSFTHINEEEVCKKYVIKETYTKSNKTRSQTKKFKRIDNKMFPEHWDTDNFFRNENLYHPNDEIVVTQKLHGTSGRFAHQLVKRKLTFRDKIALKFGVSVNEYEYDCIAGSRRVIKDRKSDKVNVNYYEPEAGNLDIWNEWLEKVKFVLPKGYILYGEIIGYTGQKQIQKNYTYGCEQGISELYIYRITNVNPDGIVYDLPWDDIVRFCEKNQLMHVPELWRGKFSDFDVNEWMNQNYAGLGYKCVRLAENSPCDEGVCIRKEGDKPYVSKAKSPNFLQHETKQIDFGNVDLETQQSS